jgi:hypothetical protein
MDLGHCTADKVQVAKNTFQIPVSGEEGSSNEMGNHDSSS